MIDDIFKRVDAIVRDHQTPADEKLMALPDAWVLTPTNITMGDLRVLVARVRECEKAANNQTRAELIQVAAQLFSARIWEPATLLNAADYAKRLIDVCGEMADAIDEENQS